MSMVGFVEPSLLYMSKELKSCYTYAEKKKDQWSDLFPYIKFYQECLFFLADGRLASGTVAEPSLPPFPC